MIYLLAIVFIISFLGILYEQRRLERKIDKSISMMVENSKNILQAGMVVQALLQSLPKEQLESAETEYKKVQQGMFKNESS